LLLLFYFKSIVFLSSRLVLWLTVSSALLAPAYLIHLPSESDHLCAFQAWWTSFFDWAIAGWIVIMAFNLHQTVVRNKRDTTHLEKYYHMVVWIAATLFATLPFLGGTQVYGQAGAWCWIVNDQQAWRFTMWYGPLIIMFVYVLTMYIWIIRTLYAQKSSEFYQREAEEEIRTKWQTSLRLSRYPLIFIILWIFPIINRIQNWIADDDGVFFLVLMHALCTSIQGTINSITYCIDERILYHCTPNGTKSAFLVLISKERRQEQQVQKYQLKQDEDLQDAKPDMENVSLDD